MEGRKAYVTSLIVFVTAAFFIGLVAGANWARSSAPVQEGCADTAENNGDEKPDNGEEPGNGGSAVEYREAPGFDLQEPGTGAETKLADFAGSSLLLFVATHT